MKHFLSLANERAREAQTKADKIILDIDDLEAEESVESIILSSVSGEDTKDRTDREIVTPWLKFLWETYRIVLEILRNNNKLEHVYQVREHLYLFIYIFVYLSIFHYLSLGFAPLNI